MQSWYTAGRLFWISNVAATKYHQMQMLMHQKYHQMQMLLHQKYHQICKCCTKIPSWPNFLVSPQLLFRWIILYLLFRAAIQFSTLLRPKHKQRIFVANIKPGFWHICHKPRIWVAFQIYFVIVCLSPLCSSVQTELRAFNLVSSHLRKCILALGGSAASKWLKKCINVYFNNYVFFK